MKHEIPELKPIDNFCVGFSQETLEEFERVRQSVNSGAMGQ